MGAFDDLPTLAEVTAQRAGKPIRIGPSRLQVRMSEDREDRRQAQVFRTAVWVRDGARCRKCRCKVFRQLRRVADRGEVHHLHGRIGPLRHEPRAALLVCASCHELLTGKVDERWRVRGTQWFGAIGVKGSDQTWIDATYPVEFERIA